MTKLVSVAAVGIALVAIGCEPAPARPAEAPHAAAAPVAPTPPTPPTPPPPPGDHAGGSGWPHHGEGGDAHEGMAHHPGPKGEHDGGGPGHAMGERMRGHQNRARGAQSRGEHGPMEHGGGEMARELATLGVHFYPAPSLIRRSKEIGLTPDQLTKIRGEMLTTQSKAIDLHAKVQHSRVEAARLLSAEKIDEKAVDAQIDEATKAEAEMHKLHVGAMLRIRALLTAEQRQKLDERKKGMHHDGKPGGVAGGPMGQDDDDGDDDDDDDVEG